MKYTRICGAAAALLTAAPLLTAFPKLPAHAAAPNPLTDFAQQVRALTARENTADYYGTLTFDPETAALYRDGEPGALTASGLLSVRGGRLFVKTGTAAAGTSAASGALYTPFADAAADAGYEFTESGGVLTITNDFQTARLIVRAEGEIDPLGAQEAVSSDGLHILQYADERQAYAAYCSYSADPAVRYVQPSRVVSLDPEPDAAVSDTVSHTYNTWGADRIGTEEFIAEYLDLEQLPEITVAVIDTGINEEPAIFDGRILPGGVNYSNSGDDSPADDKGHGTHCTGTICELTPSNVRILPIKAFDVTGNALEEQIYLGIMYAIEQGAQILSMSFGGLGYSPLEAEALAYAESCGVICVCAAGNNGDDASYYCPGGIETAITVGAVDSEMNRAGFSNFGKLVDVMAPGVGIVSYTIGGPDSMVRMNGTSMATPHVTACCALLCSYDPEMTPRRAEALLELNAVDLGEPGFDREYAWGFVNLHDFRWDDGICLAPEFSLKPGNFGYAQTVSLTCETPGAQIYYTTDSSVPSAQNGTLYTGPITVSHTTRLRACAVKAGCIGSVPSEALYAIGGLDVPEPYTVEDGVLMQYRGVRTKLTVPDSFDGVPVTAVASEAFAGNPYLQQITLPDTVQTLGNRAFAGCDALTSVTAPGVQSLGAQVFADCGALCGITAAPVLTAAGEGAFSGCASLKAVRFDGLTALPANCFSGCTALANAQLPDVTVIGESAFLNCQALRAPDLRWDLLTEIGNAAFSGCTALTGEIPLPALQTLGEGVWLGDAALLAVYLPERITALPASSFCGCSGLMLLSLPGVTKIGADALALGKKNFDGFRLNMPFDKITSVGTSAFSGCPIGDAADRTEFSALTELQYRSFAGVTAGALTFPQLKTVPQSAFSAAAVKILELPCAQKLASDSVTGAAVLTVSEALTDAAEDAWTEGVTVCADGTVPALADRTDYKLAAKPVLKANSGLNPGTVQHHYLPLQMLAGGIGLTYQWYRLSGGSAELIPGAEAASYDADTSQTGEFSYRAVVTDANGKTAKYEFSVTVSPQEPGTLPSDGFAALTAESVYLLPDAAAGTYAESSGAAVQMYLTDGAGNLTAVSEPLSDGRMRLAIPETAACVLTAVPLRSGAYSLRRTASAAESAAVQRSWIILPDRSVYSAEDGDVPLPAVVLPDGTALTEGTDYTLLREIHNHFCTVTVFGTGAYSGSASVTYPAYPRIQADTAIPVSMQTKTDSAVFVFVPKTAGTYLFAATRAAGYAEEQLAYQRIGRYDGGSKYVNIHTAVKVCDSPDGTGTVYASNSFSTTDGYYFQATAALNAGQVYYIICTAESAAEYNLTVTQQMRRSLRYVRADGVFTQVYTGSPVYPEITLTAEDGTELQENVDYQRIDSGNNAPGQGKLTLVGMGLWTGKLEFSYEIAYRKRISEREMIPPETPVEITAPIDGFELIWFTADTAADASAAVLYRVLNQKLSGGKQIFSVFRYDALTGIFTRIPYTGQENDFLLKNGEYCLLIQRAFTDSAGKASFTLVLPHDLSAAEVTVGDAVYTGAPVTPEMTVRAADGTLLEPETDYTVVFPEENGNILFGEADFQLRPTDRSCGIYKGTMQILVECSTSAPLLGLGDHTVRLTPESRLGMYRVCPKTDTTYQLSKTDVMNTVMRVFSPEGELLDEVFGTGVQSLSFTVPAGETRYIMVKFSSVNRTGTLHFSLDTDLRLLSDCEQISTPVAWTGARVLPDVTFTDGDYTLVEDVDYTLRYTCDDTKLGTASANFIGIGDYFGVADVEYEIIAPDLFAQEASEAFPILLDEIYTGAEQSGSTDYLIYCYQAGIDSELKFDIYDCMCFMTVQRYDSEGHYQESIYMRMSDSMTFSLAAGETGYLLFSKSKVSGWNQTFRCILRDLNAADYTIVDDTENGVSYRIRSGSQYAEAYAVNPKVNPIRLLPEIGGIPVTHVPEGLLRGLPADSVVIGYAGCKAAEYAARWGVAYEVYAPENAVLTAGDVNGDGRFTVTDAVFLLHVIAESTGAVLSDAQWDCADCNGDGTVDLLDYRALIAALEA